MELSLDFSSIWVIIILAAIALILLVGIFIICLQCCGWRSCGYQEINPELREPTLQWNEPATIEYGEALSEKQLNAVCTQVKNPPTILDRFFNCFCTTENGTTIAGTFIYYPREGTVLEAGEHTLSVHFTPHHKFKRAFSSALRSVPITVQKAVADYSIKWDVPNIQFGSKLISAEHLKAKCVLNEIREKIVRGANGKAPESIKQESQSFICCFYSSNTKSYISNENIDEDDMEEIRSGVVVGAFVFDPPSGT